MNIFKRCSIIGLALLVMASATTALVPTATLAEEPQAYFVDLLYLNEGKTPEDAKGYFEKVTPVIAEHGLSRITPGFVTIDVMNGKIEPDLVNVWSVGDAKTTFSGIFSDEAYTQHISLRNSIFDMKRSHMLLLKAAE